MTDSDSNITPGAFEMTMRVRDYEVDSQGITRRFFASASVEKVPE